MSRKYHRPLPPYNPQRTDRGQIDCWARSLASWITATRYSPLEPWSPDDILSWYQDIIGEGGMLDFEKHIGRIANDWNMTTEIIGGPNFTANYIYEKLAWHSHMYMVYPSIVTPGQPPISHAIVVYGILGIDAPPTKVQSMDPMRGFPDDDLSYFAPRRTMFVGWIQNWRL
jgi:hypothetical protein